MGKERKATFECLVNMQKRCQMMTAWSKASHSFLTKQTDITCVLNIPLLSHKAFQLTQLKEDDLKLRYIWLSFYD